MGGNSVTLLWYFYHRGDASTSEALGAKRTKQLDWAFSYNDALERETHPACSYSHANWGDKDTATEWGAFEHTIRLHTTAASIPAQGVSGALRPVPKWPRFSCRRKWVLVEWVQSCMVHFNSSATMSWWCSTPTILRTALPWKTNDSTCPRRTTLAPYMTGQLAVGGVGVVGVGGVVRVVSVGPSWQGSAQWRAGLAFLSI